MATVSESVSFSHSVISEECSDGVDSPKLPWFRRVFSRNKQSSFSNKCQPCLEDGGSGKPRKSKPRSLFCSYTTTVTLFAPCDTKKVFSDVPLRKLRRSLNREMEHLTITGRKLDCRFGNRFRRVSMESLSRLTLSGNQLYRDPYNARNLLKHLPENLQLVNLSWNGLGSDMATHLADSLEACHNLRWLGLCGNPIGPDGLKALVHRGKVGRALTLDLWDCEIGNDGAALIGEALGQEDTKLEKLVLDMNGIGNEGIEALAKGLEKNTTLLSLELYCNDIGDEGLIALIPALKTSQIEYLNLRANHIGPKGVEALAKALNETSLRTLCLSHNNIGDAGVEHLAVALQGSCELEELSLSFNGLSNKSIQVMSQALLVNTSLKQLNMDGNLHMDRRRASSLVNALSVNKTLTDLSLLERNYENHLVNDKLDFFLQANRLGRKNWGDLTLPLPAWPVALQTMQSHPDLLFSLLSERPDILSHAGRTM